MKWITKLWLENEWVRRLKKKLIQWIFHPWGLKKYSAEQIEESLDRLIRLGYVAVTHDEGEDACDGAQQSN